MNLFFRLMWLLLRRTLQPKPADAFSSSSLSFRVWPTDLDLNLHLNNGRYLTLMDLGRFDLMLRTGMFKRGLQEKWMPVIADVKIRYMRSLKPFQRFTITTRLVGWESRWFYLEQSFEHDGHVHARALVKAAIVKERRTIDCKEVLEAMQMQMTPPPIPPEFQQGWVSTRGTRPMPSAS